MSEDEFAALADQRDAARQAYREAREARDRASDEASGSLAKHRRVLELLERARDEARRSRWRHRDATARRAVAKRRCDEAWRRYRELDRRVREARPPRPRAAGGGLGAQRVPDAGTGETALGPGAERSISEEKTAANGPFSDIFGTEDFE